MQPAADKTYTLFGLAKFTLLLMFTLLAAAPFLHNVQTAPLASARFDALAAAPFLHKVQTAPLASARFDALAAAPPLHEVQTTPLASARFDALAAAPFLHKVQTAPLASARFDALAAAPPLHELAAAPPLHEVQTALLAITRTDALAAAPLLHKVQTAPSASTRTYVLAAAPPLHKVQTTPPASARSDALAASSPLHFMLNPISEDYNQHAAATNLPHSLASQHGAADKTYKLFSMAKFSLFVAVSLLAPITIIGKALITCRYHHWQGADRRQLHRLPAAVDIFTGKTCRYYYWQGADRRQLHGLPAAVGIFTGKTCRDHRCFPLSTRRGFSHQLAPPRPTIRRGFINDLKLYQLIQPERGPVQIERGYREPKCSLT
ncbi:hypothetical protein T492DRAFT_973493 [Pavlovales sp. CCMP2436]|nr:hypothetical protein T492DRAFT_973493 [Pavlovales sp. CCMP2436]